jgi:DNA adenine methylase
MIPFLKWPGGKRWFVARHPQFIPSTFGRYFEPFLGGGSVFFHIEPTRAILADTNQELIAVYRAMKRFHNQVEHLLTKHQQHHCEDYYYRVRDTIPVDRAEKAARTIYLNRTCFNGIYRVNLNGCFNVPVGTKDSVLLPTDDFAAVARLLKRAKLKVADFEPVIEEAEKGDLVFADPPYVVGHNNNGFVKYNEHLFKWKDQERLADALARARGRGVKIVATNADHSEVRDLYRQRGFALISIERYSSISGVTESRKQFQELVILANCSGDNKCRPKPQRSNRSIRPPATKGTRSKH